MDKERIPMPLVDGIDGWKSALADMTAARDALCAALAQTQTELKLLRETTGKGFEAIALCAGSLDRDRRHAMWQAMRHMDEGNYVSAYAVLGEGIR